MVSTRQKVQCRAGPVKLTIRSMDHEALQDRE
jgi:hypothetical protein